MSTSSRTVIGEAAAAAALTVAAVAVAAPTNLWMPVTGLHPGWLPVIIMAARYGTRGLFFGLAFTALALVGAELVLGGTLESALAGLTARQRSGADLLALAAATVVAWIAMMHETRLARVADQLAEAAEAQAAAETTVHALHDSLAYLRRRHDRLDVSLSVWRDAAARIERGEPAEAAKAVLELCEARLGAAAGLVQMRDGNRLTTVAVRGMRAPASTTHPGLHALDTPVDTTIREAILGRRVTPAVPGAGEADSDVAAPVLDEDSGVVVGVISLRGVSAGSLRAADLADLRVLAQWLAPALARPPYTTPRTIAGGRQS